MATAIFRLILNELNEWLMQCEAMHQQNI